MVSEKRYTSNPDDPVSPVYCSSPIDNGNHRHAAHVGLSHKLTRMSWPL